MSSLEIADIAGEVGDHLLRGIGKFASDRNIKSYLVGGLVRDLLLQRRSADIDVMVETDAIEFVKELKKNWTEAFPQLPSPQNVIGFKRYKTAKLQFLQTLDGESSVIDFSSARSEQYESSGKAPAVKLAGIEEDIFRRDFSINALAIHLSADNYGELVDLVGGQDDLRNGIVRILHNKSFEDDPARLIRGLRFCSRFGFLFDSDTNELFLQARDNRLLFNLPPARRYDELLKAFNEQGFKSVLSQMQSFQLWPQFFAELPFDALDNFAGSESYSDKDSLGLKLGELRLARLLSNCPDKVFEKIVEQFELPTSKIDLLNVARQ